MFSALFQGTQLQQVLAQDPVSGQLDTPEVAWAALGPALILMAGGVVFVTITSLMRGTRKPGVYALLTTLVAGASLIDSIWLWNRLDDPGGFTADGGAFSTVGTAWGVDHYSIFIGGLLAIAVMLTAWVADDYLRREGLEGPEFYILLLLAAGGGTVMAAANELITLFVGLEVLSISVYVLAAMHARRARSQEAAMKYFVLGAFASAIFLYGIAMVYGATGSTSFVDIFEFLQATTLTSNALLLIGFAMLLVGFGFKVAAVPFHQWTPDVYEGSPSPVTGFMASAVKVAAFAALIRVFVVTFSEYVEDWQLLIAALSIASMVVGSFMAIVQTNVKRMLAYSSIGHSGYILLGVFAATPKGVSAVVFYLATYTFIVIGSFAVVTVVGRRDDGAHDISDYAGLAKREPLLAGAFAVFLFAQAGVPLTSGFVAKFYVITAAIDGDDHGWILALVAMISAVVAAFLYLRIVVAMFLQDPEDEAGEQPRLRIPAGVGLTLVVTVIVTIGIGFLPGLLADLAGSALPDLATSSG